MSPLRTVGYIQARNAGSASGVHFAERVTPPVHVIRLQKQDAAQPRVPARPHGLPAFIHLVSILSSPEPLADRRMKNTGENSLTCPPGDRA